ncbi:hypothetical protein LXL04_020363 [Taraxacum kok-saghyz]
MATNPLLLGIASNSSLNFQIPSISIKLDRDNYSLWRSTIISALETFELETFELEAFVLAPSPPAEIDEFAGNRSRVMRLRETLQLVTMNFAELLSPNAANNVKAPKRLRPKPKSTPIPPPQPTNNEIITRTEEEQTVEINQISENTNNDWQSSFEKPHEENAEPFITLESLNDILPQSTTVEGDSPPVTVTETQTNYVSVDGNVENGKGPTEADLESFAQIDPLTGEEASIFNDNQDFQIENLSSVSNDAENSHFWEPLDMSAGPKVENFKPKAPT